ncbi:hypothetical protein [Arthrobacter sulfonylureivorans]|uniref:Uncharacterized protein n=1 Tax=Arthrobacter sulfonylureivorans TaxID=2486855 RepID=A0ABY3WBU7_9MICC|nr:hypothetical protein [Arthrobacter sulfonylureivorans]UNK47832.1 hypothetical protein MNQ99_18320 [Arthrobacter sulfonylureivorans]
MNDSAAERLELRRRMAVLAPLFRDLGSWIIGSYTKAGILDAMPDASFPVSDGAFSLKTRGFLRRQTWVYSPRGPVYFSITRAGRLILAEQDTDASITDAVCERAQLARPGDFPWATSDAEASGLPEKPLFLMDPITSDLYIKVTARNEYPFPVQVRPVGQYARECAGLFIAAFKAAR